MDQSSSRPPRLGGHARTDRGIQLRNGIPIDGGIRGRCARQQHLTTVTWLRFSIWLVIGLVIYGVYGYRHSRLNANRR